MKLKTASVFKSEQEHLIGNRFLIKASCLDSGVYPKSICLVIKDIIEDNFKVKYFNSEEETKEFINLLLKL
jgi:hypothetical protein